MTQPQGIPEAVSLCSLTPSPGSDEGHKQATLELGKHPQLADKRSWLKTVLFQIACFLWILPIAVLLTLNIKKHIVGASAWCPGKDCYVGWFNPVRTVPLDNLRAFDRRDHNLLGALQFAAKALEIWFELIALALVYLITFLIAGKKDGLPIGFLTRPTEFSDLPGMFDPLLWKTLPRMFGAKKGSGGLRFRLRIHLFVGFTMLLCILCNLMGPATAVLALPSLQWIDTPLLGNRVFGDLLAGNPPTNISASVFDLATSNCSEGNLRNLEFSCAADLQASQLDSWIESFLASGFFSNGQTQEGGVKFSLNQTYGVNGSNITTQQATNIINWVPNRQVLSELNGDLAVMSAMSLGLDESEFEPYVEDGVFDAPDTYALYNRSLQLTVQRIGPVLGTIAKGHSDRNDKYTWTTPVDRDREIRCYARYLLENPPYDNYTKCVRVGDGWSSDNKQAKFTIQGNRNYTTNTSTPDVEVSIFTSDRAQFFRNGEFPSWLPSACLEKGQSPSSASCDWERLFHVEPDADLFNRTRNVTTIEMQVASNDTSSNSTTVKYSFDFVAFLNFTTYQLDPSPLTNPQTLVQTHDLPVRSTNVHIDPAWVLAAWTVDNNGLLYPDRTAAIELSRVMNRLLDGTEDGDYLPRLYMSMLPVLQTLSLIDFTTKDAAPGTTPKTAEKDHPLLTRNAKIYVWAYGLESRSSKLGITVALLGVAVVLVQLVLGFVDRRRYRSGTQLLVAALEHVPAKEFEDYEHDEAKVARMRFHVRGTSSNAGKYVFRKMAGHS